MFYENQNVDPILRFGDIIEGFQLLKPVHDNFDSDKLNFHIEVENIDFFVVTTPCCSIERKTLSIAPLKKIRNSFFQNSFFAEDLTRINQVIPPEKSIPEFAWINLSNEEKERRIGIGPSYAFIDLFIYESSEFLPKYDLNSKDGNFTTGYYMLDFKEIFVINSKLIARGKSIPKVLQLSIETRNDLRTKLSKYFNRVPEEDEL
jgi:hypothetical protein